MKNIFVMCGIPGSGKSTWIKNKLDLFGGTWISRDKIRFELLKEGEEYFSHESEVLEDFYKYIKESSLNPNEKDIYIDATHLSPKVRQTTLNAICKFGEMQIIAVNFDISLNEALKRNEQRSGLAKVPRSVIRRMHSQKVSPGFEEGFDIIIEVDENNNETFYTE